MPRASRYLLEGYTYHLTHRCHDRRFLLRFVRDRDAYVEWLRIGVRRYKVPVYGFCVTSNHVHVVVHVDDGEAVGLLMHLAAGATAQAYNRRKTHTGSMWEHPYQCTLVEDGQHLLNCLRYVDMNMVRAGVVAHPREWKWCGFLELMGKRQRYRMLDLERLVDSAGIGDMASLRARHEEAIAEYAGRAPGGRESQWTEPLATGSREFVENVSRQYRTRYNLEMGCADEVGNSWTVRETAGCAYG